MFYVFDWQLARNILNLNKLNFYVYCVTVSYIGTYGDYFIIRSERSIYLGRAAAAAAAQRPDVFDALPLK